MPPAAYLDIEKLDFDNILVSQEEIYKILPHRYEFMRLDAIVHMDVEAGLMAGYHNVTEDEFWVRGHIPDRPIMPGVIMVEAAAQLLSFFVRQILELNTFIGFVGIESAKFRSTVVPGQKLYLLGHLTKIRPGRTYTARIQGVADGVMVFETVVAGMKV